MVPAKNRRNVTLAPEQMAGVTAGQGLVLLESGAGTGKTTTLTYRAGELVRLGIAPQNVSAVTFTRIAAREIRERVKAMVGAEIVSGTMHSLAVRILRAHWQAAGFRIASWQVMQESDTAALFTSACTMAFDAITDQQDPTWSGVVAQAGDAWVAPIFVNTMQAALSRDVAWRKKVKAALRKKVSRWKENGLTPADAAKVVAGLIEKNHGVSLEDILAAQVHRLFASDLRFREILELSDIVPRCVEMMDTNPQVARDISRRVKHLMVDEYQDSNPMQLRFLRWLSVVHGNVTLIGDDDQSIYMFRGAVRGAMRRAPSFFPEAMIKGVTHVRLAINRRSPDPILAAACALVGHNPRDQAKQLSSGKDGSRPRLVIVNDDLEEAQYICDAIRSSIQKGGRPNANAVLSRGKVALQAVIRALVRARVPHRVVSGLSFIERAAVRDMMAWMRLVAAPHDELSFVRASSSPPRGLGKIALASIVAEAGPRGSLVDAMQRLLDQGKIKGKAREGAAEMAGILGKLSLAYGDGQGPAQDVLIMAIRDTGYEDWAIETAKKDGENPDDLIDVLEQLLTLAEMSPAAATFIDDVLMAEEDATNPNSDSVHIGTIHSAKGGEWDNVFIPGFSSTLIPASRGSEALEGSGVDCDDPWITLDGCLEEERCILHVGMTRARSMLTLVHAHNRKIHGTIKPLLVSEFLADIGQAHLDVIRPSSSYRSPVGATRRFG